MSGRSTTRRRMLAYGGALLAGGVVGCLDEGEPDHELGNPEPYVRVQLRDDETGRLDPSVVHLLDGGMIEWDVESGVHDVTAYHPMTYGTQQRIPDGAEPWASDRLTEGDDSFEHVFETQGVYDYVCTNHEGVGMNGSIVVGWPEPEDEPGLEPPAETYPDAAVRALESHNERIQDMLEEEHEG